MDNVIIAFTIGGILGLIAAIIVLKLDRKEKTTRNEKDKCLNEGSQASRYKRMIYVILIVVLVVLFMTAILSWISVTQRGFSGLV